MTAHPIPLARSTPRARFRDTFRVTGAILCMAGIVVCAGCAAKPKRREMRVPVTIALADRRPVPDVIEATGTVEPRQTVAINPQVGGLVTAIHFTEGQEVRANQILSTDFTIPVLIRTIGRIRRSPTRRESASRTNSTTSIW